MPKPKPRVTMLKPLVAKLDTSVAKPLTARAQRLTGKQWGLIRARILQRDNGLCQCEECQAALAPKVATEVDHRVELADGGSNADSNLQSLAKECHERKTEAARLARLRGYMGL